MGIFSKLFKSRDKPQNYLSSHLSFLWGATSSGQPVTERTAMQVTAVYACVRILSEAIASLPLNVYVNHEDGSMEKTYGHNLSYLLHDAPNPEMTSFIFRETLMSHLLLWGNAYAQIVRNGMGQVVALYPLLPHKMDVSRDSSGQLIYTYTKNSDEFAGKQDFRQVKLTRSEVLHIPGLGFDGLIGYSPIAMAKNAIGIAIATEEYGATFFANGATPGGILEHPGIVKDPEKLRQSWQAQFSGKNSHNVAVLEEGMVYKQLAIAPEEAQFLETRKFQINEIARIFRVPPHMVGDLEKSSFSNIEQQSLEFVKYTLNPWVSRWEQSMQQSLLLPSERHQLTIHFNVDGLLRGDYQSRMNGYAVGINNGFMSPNDVRRLEGMNPIPDEEGGNRYMVNGNMVPLKDAGAAYASAGEVDTDD